MRTTERECLDALQEAAERLGKSPTKAEYEELGLRPASATIIRVVGGWNEAKERAELKTFASRGSRVQPQPDDVDLPENLEWNELSVDQRWHYRNRSWNMERTLKRRARLRAWANDHKRERGCRRCGVTDPAVLDFHHRQRETKLMDIGDMITHGYGKKKLCEEMEKCDVLCSNCHRKEHRKRESAGALRAWVNDFKRSADGCSRCPEADFRALVFTTTVIQNELRLRS